MSGKIMGYARVSSSEQNLDRQIEELRKYVPEQNIITDKASGKDLNREGYAALKGALGLREGDTLVVKSLDRLSRKKADIKSELEFFKKNGIRLMILDLPTSLIEVPDNQEWIVDMINNILIEVISSMAEQERKTIKSRQKEGIEIAKKKGKHLGRPRIEYPDNWDEWFLLWKQKKITAKRVMMEVGLKPTTFYKLVQHYEE